jgi:ribosomal protein L2
VAPPEDDVGDLILAVDQESVDVSYAVPLRRMPVGSSVVVS